MFHPNAKQMSAFNFPMMPFPFYKSKPAENTFKIVKNFDIFKHSKYTIKAQIVQFNELPHVSVSKFLNVSTNPAGVPTGKGIFMSMEAWHSLCDNMDIINNELNYVNNPASVACMKLNIKHYFIVNLNINI